MVRAEDGGSAAPAAGAPAPEVSKLAGPLPLLELLAQRSPDPIVVRDPRGQLFFANKAALAALPRVRARGAAPRPRGGDR